MSQLITSNNQQSSLAATWNNAATVFTSWKLNVTDTASNAASLLQDLQVGGTSRMSVAKSGLLSVTTNNTLATIKVQNSGNTSNSGYEICVGSPGNYDGYLMFRRVGTATPGDFYLPNGGAPVFATGVSVGDPYSFGSASSGALAYYTPYRNNTGNTAELSFRNHLTNAGIFEFMGYFNDGATWAKVGNLIALRTNSQTDGRVGMGTNNPNGRLGLADTVLSGSGSLATPLLDMTQTWNTTGTPSAIKLNVTDTASNANSLLLQLQVGGVNRLQVRKSGEAIFGNGITTNERGSLWGRLLIEPGGTRVANTLPLLFSATTLIGGYDGDDPGLIYDGVHTIAQRRGTNTQKLRIYNTFTDASNNESLEIAHATYSAKRVQRVRARTLGTGIDDIGIAVEPAGNGAFTLRMPDGTATGGNNRGNKAVDLQLVANLASEVASGANSFAVGAANTASGSYSVALGAGALASGLSSAALGGDGNAATGDYTVATGLQSVASLFGQRAHSAGVFGTAGDAQASRCVLRAETIDSSALLMSLDGAGGAFLTVPTSTCWTASILITAREVSGANHASYWRRCCIENTGGTTALVGTVQTIGTDIETDVSWTVTVSANSTTDTLDIEVATPSSETTTRWVAEVLLVEVNH